MFYESLRLIRLQKWTLGMLRWKFGLAECGVAPFEFRHCSRLHLGGPTAVEVGSIDFRLKHLFGLLAVLVFLCSTAPLKANEPDFPAYTRLVEYCRGDVAHPMSLSPDKRILCWDGWIYSGQDISLASSLEEGGYFVVRGSGGDVATTIALASVLGEKHVVVIVYDYCLGVCANYLLIASAEAFVLRDALVAWTVIWRGSGSGDCMGWAEAPDNGPLRLDAGPCTDPRLEREYPELLRRKNKFYEGRIVGPQFPEPPESIVIRRALRRRVDETGRFPEVYWTWNPRYYANALKTKIVYQAYPQSQDEVDAMAARAGVRAIYDP